MGYRVSQDVYVPRDLIIQTCTTSLKPEHPSLLFQDVIFIYLPPSDPDRTQERVWGLQCIFSLTDNKEEQSAVIDLTLVDRPGTTELRKYLKKHLIEVR
jgi:hypothetical protein